MKVGDLVRNTTNDEIYIITDIPREGGTLDWTYIEVCSRWAVPKDHLEVVSESR